jgi:hypothetical protein
MEAVERADVGRQARAPDGVATRCKGRRE